MLSRQFQSDELKKYNVMIAQTEEDLTVKMKSNHNSQGVPRVGRI